MYVMEVNGNIHILKPSREGCEQLSKVLLKATSVAGLDEIYASPAIGQGSVVFVTRDRTICIRDESKTVGIGEVPALPAETAATTEIDTVQLRPYETVLTPGQKVAYSLHAFDANGRFIKKVDAPEITVGEGLDGVTAEGGSIWAEGGSKDLAGTVSASIDGKTAPGPPLVRGFHFHTLS